MVFREASLILSGSSLLGLLLSFLDRLLLLVFRGDLLGLLSFFVSYCSLFNWRLRLEGHCQLQIALEVFLSCLIGRLEVIVI